METEAATAVPSIATDLIGKLVSLIGAVWFLAHSLIILRKKSCTAEINVIWYAFSLVFVLWWSFHLAINLGFVQLPHDRGLIDQISALERQVDEIHRRAPEFQPNVDSLSQQRQNDEAVQTAKRKIVELRRRLIEGDPWTGLYLYRKTKEYLTDTKAELGLVATILLATIVPQLMNYILAGLSGCAATPKYVWQFEKIAIWSLIKFLAAFGGVFIADALGVYAIGDVLYEDDGRDVIVRQFLRYFGYFVWGMGAVAAAFFLAGVQVWILEAAQSLGKAWQEQKSSWPYRLHRRFTKNVPREAIEPAEEVKQITISPVKIWERLSPSQKQEVAALAMRSLMEGTLSAIGYSHPPTTPKPPSRQ